MISQLTVSSLPMIEPVYLHYVNFSFPDFFFGIIFEAWEKVKKFIMLHRLMSYNAVKWYTESKIVFKQWWSVISIVNNP